jgi:hypothetical protein
MSDGTRSSGGLRAVRIIAVLMAASAVGFGLITAVLGVLVPAQAPHAFHNAIVASLLLIVSAPPVIQVARAPGAAIRPLVLLAAVGVAGLATMAVAMTLDPFTLPFVLLVAVLWAVVPDRSRLIPPERPSPILLALLVAGTVPLAVYALDQASLQRADHTSEHAAFFHWVETSFYAASIVLLGLLAALRPTAFRLAAWCAGVALAVMGGASLILTEYASALPSPWGWMAFGGGLLFVALAEWEVRRRRGEGS